MNLVSNTDKLQDIKQRWDEGMGLVTASSVDWLISQLEQVQGEVIQLEQVKKDNEYLLEQAQLEINDWKDSHDKVVRMYEESEINHKETMELLQDSSNHIRAMQAENEQLKQLNEEITKYINKLVKENEQLKADKQRLVETLEWYADKENRKKKIRGNSQVTFDNGVLANGTLIELGIKDDDKEIECTICLKLLIFEEDTKHYDGHIYCSPCYKKEVLSEVKGKYYRDYAKDGKE